MKKPLGPEKEKHSFFDMYQPRNRSWITKVGASSWRNSPNTKMTHHHRGDHDFFYFTMYTNIVRGCFAPNCRF